MKIGTSFEDWLKKEKSLTFDEFSEKEMNEQNAINKEYNKASQKAINDAIGELGKEHETVKEAQEKRMSEMQKQFDRFMKTIEETVKNQGEIIRSQMNPEGSEKGESILDQLNKAYKDGTIEEVAKGKQRLKIVDKVPVDMTTGNSFGENDQVPQAFRLPGFGAIPKRELTLLNDVNAFTITGSDTVEWLYQVSEEGGADGTTEGARKNQYSTDWTLGSEKAVTKTVFTKLTTRMIRHVSNVVNEMRTILLPDILRKVEDDVFSGDGDFNNNNMRGVMTTASPIDVANPRFANNVDNPNFVDLVRVAKAQIKVAMEGSVTPTAVYIHPYRATEVALTKVSENDRRSIKHLVEVADQLRAAGLMVVETTLVGEDEMLVGNPIEINLATTAPLSYELGRDGEDFTHNRVTLLAEWEGLTFVRHNKRASFVKVESIDAALDALDAATV